MPADTAVASVDKVVESRSRWLTPAQVTAICEFAYSTYIYRELDKGHFAVKRGNAYDGNRGPRGVLISRASVEAFLRARNRRNDLNDQYGNTGSGSTGRIFAPKDRIPLTLAAKILASEFGVAAHTLYLRFLKACVARQLRFVERPGVRYVRLAAAREAAKCLAAGYDCPAGYMRCADAAECLGVSRQRVEQLVRAGRFSDPIRAEGRQVFIQKDEVETYRNERRVCKHA